MASIQQALNQMLTTAGVGAGIYAHSPAGQKRAELKKKKLHYATTQENLFLVGEYTDDPIKKQANEEIRQTLLHQNTQAAEEVFQLDPTGPNYYNYKEALEVELENKYSSDSEGDYDSDDFYAPEGDTPKAKAEARAIASLKEKQDTRTQLEKEIKERRGEYMKEVAKSRAAAAAEINKFSGGKK